MGGHTRVQDPTANFKNAFEGKATGYGLTNSLVKIIFSYAGYENAFNIVNKIKVSRLASGSVNITDVSQNPVKTIKRNASYSLVIVTVLYILANIAYFAAGMFEIIQRDAPCADNDFSAETRHQVIGCNGRESVLHQRIWQS